MHLWHLFPRVEFAGSNVHCSHPLIFLCLLSVAVGLNAQARGYHMELSDGTTGYLILVNDSSKTIEAFHFNAIVHNARMEAWVEAPRLNTTSCGHPAQFAGLRREAMMDVQSADLNPTSSPRVSVCKP